MAFPRSSGILAHPTSFPGPHGIGDLGDGAYRFLDWMAAAEQHLWQIMPLVPTAEGDSPYSSVSAFAGNPLLISLEQLAREGLLDATQLDTEFGFPDHTVDFGNVRNFKEQRLRWAFERYRQTQPQGLVEEFRIFNERQTGWLPDFARYMAIKAAHEGKSWVEWEPGLRDREPGALAAADRDLAEEIEFQEFQQFLFRRQWHWVRDYARDRAIQIIGDIPIFVAHDSADVWANRDEFRLKPDGSPLEVAGVPPDAFSPTGQFWGNPHYDWGVMRDNGYAWWVARFQNTLSLVDIIRIDHFRGFAAAWTIPAGAETAASGWWAKGPGRSVFDAAMNALGSVPVIVEDLGLITPDVGELRRALDYPGMAVLQFAFDGNPANPYIPHNYKEPMVVYPGTHDNQTTAGWFSSLSEGDRVRVMTYLGTNGSDIAWDLIRLAYESVAEFAIVTMQDVLRLGDEARMNWPGVATGNWRWRFRFDQLDLGLAAGLAQLTRTFGRDRKMRPPSGYDPYDYTIPGTKHALQTPWE